MKRSSCFPAVSILHDIIRLECVICLLECFIIVSEISHSMMSNNFAWICFKHFYHMKLKDVHNEMETISNMPYFFEEEKLFTYIYLEERTCLERTDAVLNRSAGYRVLKTKKLLLTDSWFLKNSLDFFFNECAWLYSFRLSWMLCINYVKLKGFSSCLNLLSF